jgi:hypothetical protein
MTRALCVGLMTPHESLTARSPSLAWARPLGSCLEAAACHESLRPIGRALRRGQESRPLPVLPGNRDMDRALCTKEPYLNTGVATVTGFAGESRYGTRLVYKGTISQYRSRDRYRFCRGIEIWNAACVQRNHISIQETRAQRWRDVEAVLRLRRTDFRFRNPVRMRETLRSGTRSGSETRAQRWRDVEAVLRPRRTDFRFRNPVRMRETLRSGTRSGSETRAQRVTTRCGEVF